ncbi:MAG: hypothetical protein J6M62_03755 [Selenomonadaceae bacterium]|nr:hypothetical protein [Selenomonadaceae bacterium]
MKFLIPFLTVFLLLALDGFIVSRISEPYIYQNDKSFKISSFTAKDLNGNAITQDIFAKNFTVVCLWVTKEAENSRKVMADIENLKNSTSTDFQIIGIVGDLREDSDKQEFENARKITRDFKNVLQIIPNDELIDILTKIRNAPTVFFVDDEGNIIGQPIVGNEPTLMKKELFRLTNKYSEQDKLKEKIHANIFYSF